MKNWKLNLNYYYIINILCIFMAAISLFAFDSNYFLTLLSIIIQFIAIIINNYNKEKSIINFSSIFISLSFLFNFSHIFLIGCGIEFEDNFIDARYYVDTLYYNLSIIYVMICHLLISVGINFANTFKSNLKFNFGNETEISLKDSKKIAIILMIIGLVPMAIYDLEKIILYFQGGYLNTYSSSIPHFVALIGSLFNLGAIILILHPIKHRTLFYFLVIIYKLMVMISGNRASGMIFIIAFSFAFLKAKKIKRNTLIGLTILFLIIVIFIPFIANIRSLDLTDYQSFLNTLLRNNPIVSILSEFGTTFSSVVFSIYHFSKNISFTFGLNYILPILLVLPNIGPLTTILNYIQNDLMFYINKFGVHSNLSLGGSYIGEFFYSFNWFSVFFIPFFGYIIGLISKTINKTIKDNLIISGYLINITQYFYIWVRGYFGSIYRYVIIQGIMLAVIYMFLKKLRKETK